MWCSEHMSLHISGIMPVHLLTSFVTSILIRCRNQISLTFPWLCAFSVTFAEFPDISRFPEFQKSGNPVMLSKHWGTHSTCYKNLKRGTSWTNRNVIRPSLSPMISRCCHETPAISCDVRTARAALCIYLTPTQYYNLLQRTKLLDWLIELGLTSH